MKSNKSLTKKETTVKEQGGLVDTAKSNQTKNQANSGTKPKQEFDWLENKFREIRSLALVGGLAKP